MAGTKIERGKPLAVLSERACNSSHIVSCGRLRRSDSRMSKSSPRIRAVNA